MLKIALESYTAFEEAWNNEQTPLELPIKIVFKINIFYEGDGDLVIPNSFSRKKDRDGKNIEFENLLNYTLVKLPLSKFCDFVNSNDFNSFKDSIVNV